MTDTLRIPEGATLRGTLSFSCKECGCEYTLDLPNPDGDGIDADLLQGILDEEVEDRCDDCRPAYQKRMAYEEHVNAQICDDRLDR